MYLKSRDKKITENQIDRKILCIICNMYIDRKIVIMQKNIQIVYNYVSRKIEKSTCTLFIDRNIVTSYTIDKQIKER